MEHDDKSIVKKIWQTWKISRVPNIARLPFLSWAYMNKDWKRELKNDKEIAEYVQIHFPKLYRKFIGVPFGVMKADIWRYCVTYNEGGLYTDLDTTCISKINNWIPEDAQFVVSGELKTELFCQWTFYSAPKSYIMKRIIELLNIRLTGVKFFKQMVHYYTGPTFFTLGIVTAIKELLLMENKVELAKKVDSRLLRTVPKMHQGHPLKKFLLKHKIYILPIDVFNSIYAKHHYGGSRWNFKDYVPWKIQKNNYINTLNSRK
jgi:mannosyltransferase OCH1-like enzyme